MKNIKFNCWDKKRKKYSETCNMSEYYFITFDGRIVSYAIGFPDKLKTYEEKDYEMLLYTGLKDKNGREIFEGDIIKSENHIPKTYIVEFIEGGFCGTHPNIKDFPIDINHFYDSTGCMIEVIGNKFENPELMEEV